MRFETYGDIGRYLRGIRERFGWTLEEVAEVIHVRSRYIKALEEGHLSEIPGNAYVRGYLKLYAEVLRLNPEVVLADFTRVAHLRPPTEFFIPEPTREEFKPNRQMVAASIALMLAVYIGWFAFLRPGPTPPRVDKVPERLLQVAECGSRFCN